MRGVGVHALLISLVLFAGAASAIKIPCHEEAAGAQPKKHRRVDFVAEQRELSEALKTLIAINLPKAIASKRTLGIEIEFGGLNSQIALEAMTDLLGGKLDGGMIHLKPDAKPEIVRSVYELEMAKGETTFSVDTNGANFKVASTAIGSFSFHTAEFNTRFEVETFLSGVSQKPIKLNDFVLTLVEFKARGVDEKDYLFTWENWGVLRTPGTNWIEGVWTLDKAREQILAWRGNDVATQPDTFIRQSKLGDVDVHSEPVGAGKAGIEVVTPPHTHDKLVEIEKFKSAIGKMGAKGVESGYAAGIHVNIGVQHDAPNLRAKMVRRMILRWSAIRSDVVARFAPSNIRVSPIDDDRPFYGDYSPAFLKGLKDLGEEGATTENILKLYEIHYPDMEPKYRGKWFDVNPLPLLWGKGHRIEVRLFNSDFGSGQENYLKDATELVLSMVEQAANEPIP